jgi:hypothetical protein
LSKENGQSSHGGAASSAGGSSELGTSEELRWCMDDKECLKFIDSIQGSEESLLRLEKKLVEFSKTYIFARSYEKETAEKLKKFATQFAEETQAGYSEAAYKAALCHSLNILESKIWSSLKDLYHKQDMKAKSNMEQKIRSNCSGVGIPEEFLDVDFSEAVKAFRAVDEVKSPVLKLFCLQDTRKKTLDAICEGKKQQAVKVFGSMSSSSSHVIGTDELLPLFIYVVCQSGVAHFVSTLYFIKFFSYDIANTHESPFLKSLLESTVSYIL